ncbi:MAG: DUF2520 domain-containing protein [Planctomycetes bacterium]|nr:DUF2520 domain-containing protein [Planctomycetota bacterium]
MTRARPDIAIIGAGVVGTTLGIAARRAGYPVVAVASRTAASARKAARLIGGEPSVCSAAEAAGRAELVLLTVSDDAIAPVAAALAGAGTLRAGTVVAHCSGALAAEVLAPLAAAGASVASMHPLQTFPSVLVAVDRLPGCHCFCEGDSAALSVVMQLAGDLGCVPIELAGDRKALYHAAACMACNYLATLQEAAIATAVLAGIDAEPARSALAPLVAATVDNIAAFGPQRALTGPIARGDVNTVATHLAALDATDGDLAELYRQLGRRTVRLARKAGRIDEATARRLMDALR